MKFLSQLLCAGISLDQPNLFFFFYMVSIPDPEEDHFTPRHHRLLYVIQHFITIFATNYLLQKILLSVLRLPLGTH